MITKMSKYSLIVLSSELDGFLTNLQEFGLVDITRSTKAIDDHSKEMMELSHRYKNILRKIETIADTYKDVTPIPFEVADDTLLQVIEDKFIHLKELTELTFQKARDVENASVWGDFDNSDKTRIDDLGYAIHYYSVASQSYDPSWEDEYPLQILNEVKGKIFFVILSQRDEEYNFPLAEAKFPELSSGELSRQLAQVTKELESLKCEIAYIPHYTDHLNAQYKTLLTDLDYYFANAASDKEGEDSISVLEGFAPTTEDEKIIDYLEDSEAYFTHEAAQTEDNPPVKLKNNRFARLFEPIGSLYELPNYGEVDLTPYFAPFYMLFFGFCLGDMGYGLVLILAGILASIAMPKMKAYGKLVIFLGLGTVIMAAFSGTFFGMKLPEIIPMSEGMKALFFSDMKMFWFAIIFGIFQIIFARMLNSIFCFIHKKWDPAFTNLGWSMVTLWCTLAYAGVETGISFMSPIFSYILGITGLVLVLFFSKPNKHFFLRPFVGIVSLYDITGIFGDILSYIRLFGLGTTGGILALVVNSIAMSLTGVPYVGWVFAIIMLIVGHLAMMALSCLGAFVHPVRLTFVEFYKNASFQGGGRAFNPFKINK